MTFAKRLRDLKGELASKPQNVNENIRRGEAYGQLNDLLHNNAKTIADLVEAVEAFTTTGTNYTRVIEALMKLNKGAK